MPATLRRAASISPGGLFGTGTRASGTGASLLSATLAGASGFFAGGLIGSGLLLLSATAFSGGGFGSSALALAGGFGGSGLSCSISSLAIGAETTGACVGSGFRTGSHGSRRKKIAQVMRTRSAMRRKRASSSDDADQGRTRERNETRPRLRLRLAVARGDRRDCCSWTPGRPRTFAPPSRLEPLAHRERDVAEAGARRREHHLAQQAIRDVLVAHDRDALAVAPRSP